MTDQPRKDPFVRPFMVTGGRTTPMLDDLRLDTLVQTSPAALSAPLQFEQGVVVRLCQQPRSLAEVAATLHVPIGVARVVVGDLVTAGHAAVRNPDDLMVAALERIRDLVRAL